MNRCIFHYSLIIALAVPAALTWATSAQADNPSWDEQQIRNAEMQRQALQQQAQRGVSPQVQQSERWQREWIEQHPGEKMPSFGVLEKLHRGEITNNINNGFARMRQARQAGLQREYQMAKQNQERALAARHINWSPQQWANWNKEYDQQKQQQANDYLEAARQSGEMARLEALEQQRRRNLGY